MGMLNLKSKNQFSTLAKKRNIVQEKCKVIGGGSEYAKEYEDTEEEALERLIEETPAEEVEEIKPIKKEVSNEESEEESFPTVITENQLLNMKLDKILELLK